MKKKRIIFELSISLFLSFLFLLIVKSGFIDVSFLGVYTYGYERYIFYPDFAGIMIIIFVELFFVGIIRAFKRNNFLNIQIIVIMLFALLYLYKIDGNHCILTDSYTLLSGAVDILNFFRRGYRYSPTFALFILPWIIFTPDEFIAQLGVVFYYAIGLIIFHRVFSNVFSRKVGYVLVVILMVNPFLVVITRTLSYEPLLLLLFGVHLHFFYKLIMHIQGKRFKKTFRIFIIESLILILITYLRFIYFLIIVIPAYVVIMLFLIFSFVSNMASNMGTYYLKLLIFWFMLLILTFISTTFLVNPTFLVFQSSSVVKFSFIRLYLIILYIFSVPNTPPYRSGFVYYLFRTRAVLFLNMLMIPFVSFVAIIGAYNIFRRERFITLYLLSVLLANMYTFSYYQEFQIRYLFISFVIMSMFLSVGSSTLIENRSLQLNIVHINLIFRKLRTGLLLIFLAFLIIATINSSIAVSNWDNKYVMIGNGSQISKEDLEYLFKVIKSYDGKKVLLSSAMVSAAYFYNYKYHMNIEIVSLSDVIGVYGLNSKTFREVLLIIKDYLSRGYLVFYLAGWPEIDNYKPTNSEYSYSWFYRHLKQACSYEILIVGRRIYRTSFEYYAPAYELLILYRVLEDL